VESLFFDFFFLPVVDGLLEEEVSCDWAPAGTRLRARNKPSIMAVARTLLCNLFM